MKDLAVVLSLAATILTAAPIDYTTSWIANDGGWGEAHIPHDMLDIFVSPDGTVATICTWDEGGTNVGIFRDGRLVSRPEGSGTGGWGRMSGKQVVNYGVGGATSSAAPGAAQRAVAQKPGYVCILYGSNDAITGKSADAAKENIRAAIGVCKNAGVRAIVGTPPPMRDGHSLYDGPARGVAEAIRAVASEEGVPCVDLYGAFGDCNGLLVADGLHPNAAGAQLIASKFNSKL